MRRTIALESKTPLARAAIRCHKNSEFFRYGSNRFYVINVTALGHGSRSSRIVVELEEVWCADL